MRKIHVIYITLNTSKHDISKHIQMWNMFPDVSMQKKSVALQQLVSCRDVTQVSSTVVSTQVVIYKFNSCSTKMTSPLFKYSVPLCSFTVLRTFVHNAQVHPGPDYIGMVVFSPRQFPQNCQPVQVLWTIAYHHVYRSCVLFVVAIG